MSAGKPKPRVIDLGEVHMKIEVPRCAGRNLSGREPDHYRTPPTRDTCANLRDDGPTPCWYPHCLPRKD